MLATWMAIDWGTTNRRAYAMTDEGAVVETVRDDFGVLGVAKGGFPAALAALRARLGDLPAIAAGSVGSAQGWVNTPYCAAPASLEDLAAALVTVGGERLRIVPGISFAKDERFDVMRGEEVQALGAVRAGLVPADAHLCMPGTHNKWLRLESGRIVEFTTAMTGEMFALLRDHSLLHEMLKGEAKDGPDFRQGVAEAGEKRPLLSSLFGVRASTLLGGRAAEAGASYTSGLLIGADVFAALSTDMGIIHILADEHLSALYAAAISQLGGKSTSVDSHAAFVAGIQHIRNRCR